MASETSMVRETYRFCPHCAARVEIGRVPLNALLTCELCGHEFPVDRNAHAGHKRAAPAPRRHKPSHDQGDDGWSVEGESLAERRDRMTWDAAGEMPPASLLFSGTFSFPFRLTTLGYTLTLRAGATVLIVAAKTAIWCAWKDGPHVEPATRALLWSGLSLSLAWGAVFAIGWYCLAATYALTILVDTAYGVDRIERWPYLLSPEWHGDWCYIGNGLILTLLPSVVAGAVWGRWGIHAWLGSAAFTLLLFPPFLLSMLDTQTPWHPLSPRVAQHFPRLAGLAWFSCDCFRRRCGGRNGVVGPSDGFWRFVGLVDGPRIRRGWCGCRCVDDLLSTFRPLGLVLLGA